MPNFTSAQRANCTSGPLANLFPQCQEPLSSMIEFKLTLWVHVPGRKKATPILVMSDATTRLVSGRELRAESSEEFIKQLERGWVRNFGPMKQLFVDEHRAWCSDAIRLWCVENAVDLKISPGESHTRLAILERRHQVVRRALTSFLTDNPAIAATQEDIITALCHVIPQVNRMPNLSGFSPIQWNGIHSTHPWFVDGGADLTCTPGPHRSLSREARTSGISSQSLE